MWSCQLGGVRGRGCCRAEEQRKGHRGARTASPWRVSSFLPSHCTGPSPGRDSRWPTRPARARARAVTEIETETETETENQERPRAPHKCRHQAREAREAGTRRSRPPRRAWTVRCTLPVGGGRSMNPNGRPASRWGPRERARAFGQGRPPSHLCQSVKVNTYTHSHTRSHTHRAHASTLKAEEALELEQRLRAEADAKVCSTLATTLARARARTNAHAGTHARTCAHA